jgi:acyl-CoA dehydrogenase
MEGETSGEVPVSELRIERAFVSAATERELVELLTKFDAALADATPAPDPESAIVGLARLLGDSGLLRLVVPKEVGGIHDEVRSVGLCLAREWLGYSDPLADLAFAMQGLGSYPITLGGTDAQKNEWLRPVSTGAAIAAFALTEPNAGSDVGAIATTAKRDGDDYVLDGEKVFISNAPVAHFFTFFAATRPRGEKDRLTCFILPRDAKGLTIEPMDVLGGHPIGRLVLEGVRLPESARVGDEGRGMSLALGTLHRFRTTVGAAAVGFATRALDEAIAHVKTRVQFGAPLADLQAVQLRLADMACDIEAARLLVYRAAALADSGASRHEVTRASSMAKLVATENAQRAIDHAVQLFGGRGVELGSAVARLYEEIRALRIYEGTTDVQKILVARELLRE